MGVCVCVCVFVFRLNYIFTIFRWKVCIVITYSRSTWLDWRDHPNTVNLQVIFFFNMYPDWQIGLSENGVFP